MDKFAIYYQFLISENEKYNLTSITDEQEVYIKHFEDSLSIEKALDISSIESICDVGSGAGFPSIPLKIKYPHLKVTIIEPTAKRCHFLEQTVLKCELNDVIILNERAEQVVGLRESFDLVVARAVAPLPILLELCASFVKKGGLFVAMKGPSFQTELMSSQKAIRELGLIQDSTITYSLSNGYGERSLVRFRKEKPTPLRYPRRYQLIKQKPLL